MSASVIPFQNVDLTVKVKCRICGHENHSLFKHLQDEHGMSADEYVSKYPGADVLSPFGKSVYETQIKRPDIATSYIEERYDSMDIMGVGFGKDTGFKTGKPIKGFKGFTHDDGVPADDPHYVFPAEISRDMLLGVMTGGKIYAMGPTGSGKTTWFEIFAARTGRPFYRLQFHGEMEPSEMTGIWFVNERSTMEYMYSGLVKALKLPSIIVFDEYDSGNAVVTALANALLEGKPLVLGNKGGEKIWPHKDCIIVATGNTNGMGDNTGLYASTSVQSFATMNRFAMFVTIDYMSEDDEAKMIQLRFHSLPVKLVRDVTKLAKLARDGFVSGKLSCVLSTRQVINWCNWLTMTGDIRRSFNLAFWNQLGDIDKKTIDELFQRVFG